MDSRALLLLLLIARASDALSPARFRDLANELPLKWLSSGRSVKLLQEEEDGLDPTEEDGFDPTDPEFDWSGECPEVFDIFLEMNSTGCMDQDGNVIFEQPGPVNVSDFCSTCDVQRLYDMASALNESCWANSVVLEGLRMIVPVYAAVCTLDTAGEYCAAPFILALFGSGDNDEDSTRSEPSESEWESYYSQLCYNNSTCPYWDMVLNHSFDCFPLLTMLGSLCLQADSGELCLGSAPMDGDYDEYALKDFCGSSCGPIQVDFWTAEFQNLPQCVSHELQPVIDPSGLCLHVTDGPYCATLYAEAENYMHTCNLTAPREDWVCHKDCGAALEDVISRLDCCLDTFFMQTYGAHMWPAIELFIVDECALSVPQYTADDTPCYDEFDPYIGAGPVPEESPECVELRDRRFSIVDTLKCMVEYHSSAPVESHS